MMKRILAAGVVFASVVSFAEEAAPTGEEMRSPEQKEKPRSVFTTLPLCRQIEGSAEVKKPGGDWSPAEEGQYYPLGSSFRTGRRSRLVLAFASDSTVTAEENSGFSTKPQTLGQPSRTVILSEGTLLFKLAENLPEGAFFVTAPGFTIKNPAGESRIVYEKTGDGDKATVRCLTGSLGLEGRHFDIPEMHSAHEIVIRSSQDYLSTFLYGTSGDYVVRLDQGIRIKEEIGDDGQTKRSEEKGTLEWHLSPETKVVINRAVPAIGARMSVHTMAFDASGERKSECSFCEGRSEVNSGELVIVKTSDAAALAKRAAEATETTAATDADETTEKSSSDDKKSEDKKEE